MPRHLPVVLLVALSACGFVEVPAGMAPAPFPGPSAQEMYDQAKRGLPVYRTDDASVPISVPRLVRDSVVVGRIEPSETERTLVVVGWVAWHVGILVNGLAGMNVGSFTFPWQMWP